MKFHLAINLERLDPTTDMRALRDHTLDMVRIAEQAGFEIVWAAEHHALEMTIAPAPFQMLAWWAGVTERIRLGVAVVNAAYWHPIKLAGEAALLDLISEGRLELGLGSGAYQREFDRMRPGVSQKEGGQYMQEMLPVLRALWAGDTEHKGRHWQFPRATACPKPLQTQVPIWVAARQPATFDHAVAEGCDVLTWPLTLPFSEAETYRARLDEAVAKAGRPWTGRFAMMRHTAVYESAADRQAAMGAVRRVLAQFGNLMTHSGDVLNGFPDPVELSALEGNARVEPAMLEQNLMFGSAEQVVEKLRRYEALGLDSFVYYASMGLDMAVQRRSLERFAEAVMPAFSATPEPA
ncbi:MAG: LLM class flavin-dependent oxidoreductase [Pseudomonadota bacterium]